MFLLMLLDPLMILKTVTPRIPLKIGKCIPMKVAKKRFPLEIGKSKDIPVIPKKIAKKSPLHHNSAYGFC